MERVKTGIPGFDELIEGGVPKGFNVLITGPPGAGKSIFGMQYLYNGALSGEAGIYISLDSPKENMIAQAKQFGWDFEKFERENLITFFSIPPDRVKMNLFDMLEDIVTHTGAKRIVFDSLATLMISIDQFAIPLAHRVDVNAMQQKQVMTVTTNGKVNPLDYELLPNATYDQKGRIFYDGNSKDRIVYLVMHELLTFGTTNMIITSAPTMKSDGNITVDGVSEFAADGVILLKSLAIGETVNRTMQVQKLRSTKAEGGIKSYDINSSTGISLIR